MELPTNDSPRDPAFSDSCIHGRFLPGTKLANRYRIVSLLGKGGMGEVYRADDLKLGQSVALKFLPIGFGADRRRLEGFLNEVRLSRPIAHPNVCRVYDVGEADGQQFLSMEYIEGEDLKVLLRRIGHLPKDKGIQIARQLCAGLAAAHEKGVLHRDLKPANIMIDGSGQARITDFGIARIARDANQREVAGTPAYMAPEQLQCGETSVQSDLYSLGLILHELFTGEPVYKGSVQEILRAHEEVTATETSTRLQELDPAVERVIQRCLSKEPAQRPKSARAVAAAFPGGDPLAAAIAAGETPSPELIAASGDEGALKPITALICLAAVAVGLLILCLQADATYAINHSGLQKHPEVLAENARQIIKTLGYTDKPADQAFGFERYQRNKFRFWYRQSPEPLIVYEYFADANNESSQSFGLVRSFSPPSRVPGEIGLRLSPTGEILYFRAIPEASTNAPTATPVAWNSWFPKSLTGIDLTQLQMVQEGELPPPDASDRVQLWKGHQPESTNELYVQAAAYRGKPVYFEVLRSTSRGLISDPMVPTRIPSAEMKFSHSLGCLVLAGACFLAWRNFRSGRMDRRGAWRLFLFSFCILLLTFVFLAQHLLVVGVVPMAVAQAVQRAAFLSIIYAALEPYVRSLYPETLISWTRLFEGRWKDPLIGRDLLIGMLVAVASKVHLQWEVLLSAKLGLAPQPLLTSSRSALGELSKLAGWTVFDINVALGSGLYILMTLLLLRLLLRNRTLALFFCVPLMMLLGVQAGELQSHSSLGWGIWSAIWSLRLWTLMRFGMLAWVFGIFAFYRLLYMPITADFSHWYATRGFVSVGLVFALACLGFWLAKGRRPLFPETVSK